MALGSLTWPEADPDPRTGRHPLLLVPLGATEQHGPHLPLATDSLIAERWAEAVAAAIPGAVVAPTLPFGSSGEHQAFPGTLSIGGPALRTVIVELARSAQATWARVVFLSGHAGNAADLDAAVAQLRHEGHDVHHLVPRWPGRRNPPIDAHAGRTETALLLHLAPELVREESAEPGETRPLGELMERLRAEGLRPVAPNGILGDPVGATAGEGRHLFEELVASTVAELTGADR